MGAKVNYFLDTNVLLRYLVRDNKVQYIQAKKWFEEAQKRKIKITISSVVVAEACFVLESFYKQNRVNIADTMMVVLSQRWLAVSERKALLELFGDYKKGQHFVDSFLAAKALLNGGKVLTLDKKLLKRSK